MSQQINEKVQIISQKALGDLSFETEENEKLKDFIKIQNELIENQKNILSNIAKESKKLIEIENQRISSIQEIQKFKNYLKNNNKNSQSFYQQIDETIKETKVDSDYTHSSEYFEKMLLINKAIETIQGILYSTTEKCLHEQRSTISKEEIQTIIISTNRIIDMTIDAGVATVSIEDKIERQTKVLNALNNKEIN